MDAEEWRYFLAGPTGEIKIVKNPTDWLGELEWAEVYKLVYGLTLLPKFKLVIVPKRKAFVEIVVTLLGMITLVKLLY